MRSALCAPRAQLSLTPPSRSLSGADREEMRGLLAFLRERKLELFPDDQRHVVNVKVTQGEDQYHLAVASIGT